MSVKIIGVGSYIPTSVEKNDAFESHEFYNADGSKITSEPTEIVEKFKAITGIEERRYAQNNLKCSDLAFFAAENAIKNANIDKETIDYIIVAHNFGDVTSNTIQSDMVPCIGARVKQKLGIKNPKCVAYDLIFGCPGWLEGVIQANAFINSGIANRCLVIGAEMLSRVVDKHDRDTMIFSDGAGATIIDSIDNQSKDGILAHESASFSNKEADYLFFGPSNNKSVKDDTKYIKMYGRKIYEFTLNEVPKAMKACLNKSGVSITDIKKIILHQANEKMDEAIVKRFYRLYKLPIPENVMPMSIHKLGNSSVATIPTLYDLILKGEIENQQIDKGDTVIFASVGAGMNINAMVYKV